jgi:hypothetical protein
MNDRKIGKDLEGSGTGLMEILSRDLPGRTEENHEEHKS